MPALFGIFSVPVLLFLFAGAAAVATAIVMVLYPNPVRSALMLVLNLFSVGALYLLLNAYFLAVVQVIVYAGAIMVLFLFVIMLLNLGTPDRAVDRLKWQQPVAVGIGLIVAGLFSATLFSSLPALPYIKPPSNALSVASAGSMAPSGGGGGGRVTRPGSTPARPVARETAAAPVADTEEARDQMGTVAGVGRTLYNPNLPWLFPFEVTSFLLLIAVIGSVVLAKRRLPGETDEDLYATSGVTPNEGEAE